MQIRIYHIPKRTDNAHMKERFGTVQKTHIPKRLYADKLCLERFGAVQIRIYQNEFFAKSNNDWRFGAVQKHIYQNQNGTIGILQYSSDLYSTHIPNDD